MPTVAVINGSLRQASLNGRLARALALIAKPGLDLLTARIGDLPLYNQDMETELPAAVVRFKQEIAAADAVLFVTPEHNRSIPAALKNAIDWGTRPYGTSVWLDKPGAVIGTSGGAVGTAVAQTHLRGVLTSLGVALMGRPEAYIVFKEGLLDDADNVTDARAHKALSTYVEALTRWITRLT
ncbi:NAD(P)H-dependent oxidoreductase [Nordella sp. HKS 07]|uniref:NADPH-dependent FMN reductase n=1 Tax=Nordella sp. HKS 07 TaxID=2712222 RepID=UPI0013E17BE7|nr:NADPH-dependent FMN reductase [Nordella sp. HKS 07]QIG51934.1 NAD(P)H-dependent oxidoreductase [Nordella sp. HKS 07]